jgi:GH25 family lysozyme M1 (1,4-beta-N-acetylmuramidase)
MLKGVDFYHGQRFDPDPGTLRAAGIVFIAHKAGEIDAPSPVDSEYHRRREKYQAEGFLWAAYYYEDGEDGIRQADFFLDTVAPLDGKTALWLDLEKYANLQQAEAFLQRVHDRTGVWCDLYSRAEYIVSEIHATKSQILKNCRPIMADPSSVLFPVTPLPWASKDWFIWQKSTFNVSGVTVDLDYWNGNSIDELRKAWKVSAPSQLTVPATLVTSGYIVGYKEASLDGEVAGRYAPGQAVQVFPQQVPDINQTDHAGQFFWATPDNWFVRTQDVAPANTPPAPPPPFTPKPMVVVGAVNFRRTAALISTNIIATLKDGTPVLVTGPGQGGQYNWTPVTYNNTNGFISGGLLANPH